MDKLSLLIVDDEPLARDRARAFVGSEPAVEIMGECDNGREALAAIQRDQPDIVLLDMQMSGCTGLEVVAALTLEPRPAIIFVTGHEHFAVEAFASQAIDYVLKPFDQDRLQLALRRAIEHIELRRRSNLGARLDLLFAARPAREPGRFAFRTEGRVVFLKPDEIVRVEAANNHCMMHLTDGRSLTLRETLSALEEELGPEKFVRVNRSMIVGTDHIRELQPSTYGDYVVVLRDGLRLSLSRHLRGKLAKFIPENH